MIISSWNRRGYGFPVVVPGTHIVYEFSASILSLSFCLAVFNESENSSQYLILRIAVVSSFRSVTTRPIFHATLDKQFFSVFEFELKCKTITVTKFSTATVFQGYGTIRNRDVFYSRGR